MLHDFLSLNRIILIERCREEAARRSGLSPNRALPDVGVPVFLEQLRETLRYEQSPALLEDAKALPQPSPMEIGRTAAIHGAELLRMGFSVDQLVHGYGDVCQAVTGLALEQKAAISLEEFRILNFCLDNAIAGAVTAFGQGHQRCVSDQVISLSDKLDHYADDKKRLIDIAIRSFSAIKTGKMGFGGATGALLHLTLEELRAQSEHALAEIRLEVVSLTHAVK